jgi:hypothetical protein
MGFRPDDQQYRVAEESFSPLSGAQLTVVNDPLSARTGHVTHRAPRPVARLNGELEALQNRSQIRTADTVHVMPLR